MLFGKHINKFYLKFIWLYMIGVVGLVAVDWFQLYIPESLGQIVDMFSGENVDLALLWDIVKDVILVAVVLFVGRIAWRLSIFAASQRTEAGLRKMMFAKSGCPFPISARTRSARSWRGSRPTSKPSRSSWAGARSCSSTRAF